MFAISTVILYGVDKAIDGGRIANMQFLGGRIRTRFHGGNAAITMQVYVRDDPWDGEGASKCLAQFVEYFQTIAARCMTFLQMRRMQKDSSKRVSCLKLRLGISRHPAVE